MKKNVLLAVACELESKNYQAVTKQDLIEIAKLLINKIEYTIDEFDRVWSEAGIYVADVAEIA